MPSYDRALYALRSRRTRGPGSGGWQRGWRGRATTCNSLGTTWNAGEPPSTRPGWSTRSRARSPRRINRPWREVQGAARERW